MLHIAYSLPISTKFIYSPLFPQNLKISLPLPQNLKISPSISAKFINFPIHFHKIYKFPLFSFNSHLLFTLGFFASTYFDHDAFMHHALHILDAPGWTVASAVFGRCLKETLSIVNYYLLITSWQSSQSRTDNIKVQNVRVWNFMYTYKKISIHV